jgi:zinc protease
VVGDVDTTAVVDYVTDFFGALPKRAIAAKKITEPVPSFPTGKSLDIEVDTRIPKALVVVAYATDDYWNISRNRRMSVLAEIFSEKLRETVREELGVSYSPFAYHQASRAYAGYGALKAHIYVSPEEATQVLRVVKGIADDLAHGGISAEDLELSLKPVLTGIKDYRRTNTYWLNSVLIGSLRHPQQLDWSRTFESDFAAITATEIQALAETYLISDKAASIIIAPLGRE